MSQTVSKLERVSLHLFVYNNVVRYVCQVMFVYYNVVRYDVVRYNNVVRYDVCSV